MCPLTRRGPEQAQQRDVPVTAGDPDARGNPLAEKGKAPPRPRPPPTRRAERGRSAGGDATLADRRWRAGAAGCAGVSPSPRKALRRPRPGTGRRPAPAGHQSPPRQRCRPRPLRLRPSSCAHRRQSSRTRRPPAPGPTCRRLSRPCSIARPLDAAPRHMPLVLCRGKVVL